MPALRDDLPKADLKRHRRRLMAQRRELRSAWKKSIVARRVQFDTTMAEIDDQVKEVDRLLKTVRE